MPTVEILGTNTAYYENLKRYRALIRAGDVNNPELPALMRAVEVSAPPATVHAAWAEVQELEKKLLAHGSMEQIQRSGKVGEDLAATFAARNTLVERCNFLKGRYTAVFG